MTINITIITQYISNEKPSNSPAVRPAAVTSADRSQRQTAPCEACLALSAARHSASDQPDTNITLPHYFKLKTQNFSTALRQV